jgi:hypothetical protein
MQSRLVASPNICVPPGGWLNLGTGGPCSPPPLPLTPLIISFFLLRCASVCHMTHTITTKCWRRMVASFALSTCQRTTTCRVQWTWYWQGDWLLAGRSGLRTQVEARFSVLVKTTRGDYLASCTYRVLFPGGKRRRGVALSPTPIRYDIFC